MKKDQFLQMFDSSELKVAEEFLTKCLPFLTRGLCKGCSAVLHDRIRSLHPGHDTYRCTSQAEVVDGCLEGSVGDGAEGISDVTEYVEGNVWGSPVGCNHADRMDCDTDQKQESPKVLMSWADLAQQEELEKEKKNLDDVIVEEMGEVKPKKTELSREQRERLRFTNVGRKKDFVCLERVNGRMMNILEGLELHTGVFSAVEQKKIVDFIYELQEKGRNNELGEHTYSEPRKWMRGKGRVTIQFGCCYNYAEKNGIPPGIIRHAIADPLPKLFKVMVKRLIGWHVMPTDCVPDSCIVNIYEPGDCIPPHIDNHDFVRPFCSVSFLSECNIAFGSNLKIAGPGEFIGSTSIPLPVGSVLVLNGNGADVAKHCIPAVPLKRISITFRKMDEIKWPRGFKLEPDLQNIMPYDLGAGTEKEPYVEVLPDLCPSKSRGSSSSGRLNLAKSRSPSEEGVESVESSLRHGFMNDEGRNRDSNKAFSERRVRMQHRREDDSSRRHSIPTLENQRVLPDLCPSNSRGSSSSGRLDLAKSRPPPSEEGEEAVESSLRHGFMNDEGRNRGFNKAFSERRVRMQHNRREDY